MRGKTGFAARVKKVIMQTAEKKYKSTSPSIVYKTNSSGTGCLQISADAFGSFALSHNTITKMQIIDNNAPQFGNQPLPLQGDQDDQRNGDEIYSKGLRLRIQIENDANRHNNTYKLWLVEMNRAQGDCGVPSQFFHNMTGNNQLDPVQTDRWTASYLGKYRTMARDVAVDAKTNILINKWIPFKRKMTFNKDDVSAVAKGMKEQLWLVIVAYDSTNTLYDTNIGNFRLNSTLYYSDP